jgi:hypothetical protein
MGCTIVFLLLRLDGWVVKLARSIFIMSRDCETIFRTLPDISKLFGRQALQE